MVFVFLCKFERGIGDSIDCYFLIEMLVVICFIEVYILLWIWDVNVFFIKSFFNFFLYILIVRL